MAEGPWDQYSQPEADGPWKAYSQDEPPATFNERFGSDPAEKVPDSFLHRIAVGLSLGRMGDTREAGQSPEELRAKGSEDFDLWENTQSHFKAGLERAKKGLEESHSSLDVGMGAFQSLMAPVSAAFQAVGVAGEKATGGLLTGEQINTALMVADGAPGTFARVRDGAPQVIGNLPVTRDFEAAGRALESERAPENLRRMWQEDGMHPAEAVHDAQTDAFLKHEITAEHVEVKSTDLPDEARELIEADGNPVSLSAARTDPSELVSPDVQPVRPGLAAQASKAIEDLNGLATNLQYMLDPMATGSNRAMIPAKDAMNSVRRIRWDHSRIDQDLVKKFTPDELADMWRQADEESVVRQTGDTLASEGLAALKPEQRAAVEQLQASSQRAWLGAVDAGMVEGEGLPSYTPRMMANVAMASDSMGPRALNELGRNVFTRTAQMLKRKNLESYETEAAARELVRNKMAEQGASAAEIDEALKNVSLIRNIRVLPMATARLEEATVWRNMINQIEQIGKATGDDTVAYGSQPKGWFTIDHPSFRKWRPAFEDGKPVLNESGKPVFEPVPIYMHPEFRGPMKAILDEGSGVMKAVPGAQSAYGALMALKGKAMTAILNSPLIHNQVVWGKVAEAASGKEWMGLGLYFRGNKIVKGETGRAQELIERGLNPMGHRGSVQDITGEMESPELGAPGRSWTSQIARFIPDLFDPARPGQTVGGVGDKVAAAIDKAGDFWHNTLLWDRVRDVHFGLADYLSDKMVGNGVDRLMADRIATHFSNIIVGSIPKEAMSAGARATANMLLFSRSFTLGNLSTFKQAAMGLPKPILAQIERDFGMTMKDFAEGSPEAAEAISKISQDAKSIARRKAFSTVMLSVGFYYTVNALVQHAANLIVRDSSVSDELKGYMRRWNDAVSAIKEDPFEVRHLLSRLSPTWDNEPSKTDRAYVGNDSRGTGVYARIPMGKFGEEMVGYGTKPMTMIRGKLSPMAGGLLDVLMNDKGFGQKIYNEHDDTVRGDLSTAWAVAKHMMLKHLPEGQFDALNDLMRDNDNYKVNASRLVGPALGFTTSRGAPGGPQRGEQLSAKTDFDARFNLAWPDIKKQIQRGDTNGGMDAMDAIGVPPKMQKGLVRSAQDPASSLRGRTVTDFYRYATPEQIRRFESRGQMPPQ